MVDALAALPEELKRRSLSDREIVLPYEDALQAVAFFVSAWWALLGWEGWVRRPSGIGHDARCAAP